MDPGGGATALEVTEIAAALDEAGAALETDNDVDAGGAAGLDAGEDDEATELGAGDDEATGLETGEDGEATGLDEAKDGEATGLDAGDERVV